MAFRLLSFIRLKNGKEDCSRYKEKFGVYNQNAYNQYLVSNRQLIWIHAVSVGELNSCLKLVDLFVDAGYFVLVTTTTLTSAKVASVKLPKNSVHQFMPWPSSKYLQKFLSSWKPVKAIFIESEIWPPVVNSVSNFCPMYLVNGKMSCRSFARWRLIKPFIGSLLNKYKNIFAGSELDAQRFSLLGARNVSYVGNLKFDATEDFYSKAQPQNWNDEVNFVYPQVKRIQKKIITFGSAHAVEYDCITHSISKLELDCLTILVLRHLDCVSIAEETLNKYNLNYIKWSDVVTGRSSIKNDDKVLLVDVMNLMPFLYYISDVCIICGSFVDGIGGHNALEAAVLSKPVIIGPYYHKCSDLTNDMQRCDAIIVSNISDINNNIHNLINDGTIYNKYANNARHFVLQRLGVANKIFDLLK